MHQTGSSPCSQRPSRMRTSVQSDRIGDGGQPEGERHVLGQAIVGRPVDVGLVGLGRFGKLHAAILSRLAQARLAAICDPLESEVESVGDQLGVTVRYADYDMLFGEQDLDCIFLVTPRTSISR